MRFESAQVLELVGISKEALRHWKRVLPPIAGRDGRSDGYAFEEVVALSVIAHAHKELAVPISRFSAVAHRLFQDIARHIVRGDETTVVCITSGDVALTSLHQLPQDVTFAIVRLAPIVSHLRKQMSAAATAVEDPQMQFDLPRQ